MYNKVEYYRKMMGITQKELADLIDCRRETIMRIEQNKNIPSLTIALKLQDVLKVNINYLFWLSKDDIPTIKNLYRW